MAFHRLKPLLPRIRSAPSLRSPLLAPPITLFFLYIVLFSLLRISSPHALHKDDSHQLTATVNTAPTKTAATKTALTITKPTTTAPTTNALTSTALASTTVTSIASTIPFQTSADHTQHRSDDFKLSFHVEQEDVCSTWSFNNTLFPVYENNVTYSRFKFESADIDVASDIAVAKWVGKIGIPIYFPISKRCVSGLPPTSADISDPIAIENPTSLLCTDSSSNSSIQKSIADLRATMIISFLDGATEIDDMLSESVVRGLNVFHFHAQFFPIWLSLRLVEASAFLMRRRFELHPGEKEVYPPRLLTAGGQGKSIDTVLILPDWIWFRFSNQSTSTTGDVRIAQPIVLEPHGANIRTLLAGGAFEQTLAGLQAMQDGMSYGAKIMIATKSMSVHAIQTALTRHSMNHRPAAFFPQPDRGSMLWELRLRDFVFDMRRCHDSVLQKYTIHLLRSASSNIHTVSSRSSRTDTGESNAEKIAPSVCLLSRQPKLTKSWERKRPVSRNLMPDVYNEFVRRFRSVAVLQFQLGLRGNTSIDEMDEVSMNRSSITGQMRTVRRTCAVLVGVHGAGLTHLISMREGTHVVEIQGFFKHDMFERMAKLVNNVSHTTVHLNSTVVDMHRLHEVNVTGSPQQIDHIVQLVNEKLDDSLKQQAKLVVDQ